MGVPGAETTPFGDGTDAGWEDDLDHPRSADELVTAWTTTWAIAERALDSWTPDMLDDSVAARTRRRRPTLHSTLAAPAHDHPRGAITPARSR